MKFPEKYRVTSPIDKRLNCFKIPFEGRDLAVIATDWGKWKHVSVSLTNRCPNWREMCFVKDLFFDDEEECIQLHPKRSEYVNAMPYCLHIWKPPHETAEMLSNRISDCQEFLQQEMDKANDNNSSKNN